MLIQFSRNWWVLLINGLIALILGLFAIFAPEGTMITLTKYFGFLVLLAGIILLIGAVGKVQKKENYTWLLIEAIIILVLGVIILLFTEQSLRIFIIIVGLWAIIMGILQMMLLASIKDEVANKNLVLFNAIITLAFGIAIFFDPFSAGRLFTVLIGIGAVLMGIVLIMISFNVKKVQEAEK
ncbi:MAG: DUF308 domain-containing protein [Bacteroidota bacterium]|nr:DUF308 domain-containing protein [Bacteroidota bacterium]